MVLSDPCERVVQFPRDRDLKIKNLWCTEEGRGGDSFQIAPTKSLLNGVSLIGTQTSFSTNPKPSTQQPRLSTRTFDSGGDFITLNVLLPSSGWRRGVLLSSLKSICRYSHLRVELLWRNSNIACAAVLLFATVEERALDVAMFENAKGLCAKLHKYWKLWNLTRGVVLSTFATVFVSFLGILWVRAQKLIQN